MLSDKICPYCGAKNKGLDLKESNGLFVCIGCDRLDDTKTEEKQTESSKQNAEKREK